MLVFWHFAKFKKPSNTDTKKFIKKISTHTHINRASVSSPHFCESTSSLCAREVFVFFVGSVSESTTRFFLTYFIDTFCKGKIQKFEPPPKQRQPSWWIYSILIMSSASTLESTIYVRDDDEEDTNFNGKIELIFGPMFSGKSTELHRRILSTQNCRSVRPAHQIQRRYAIRAHLRIERERHARPPNVTRAFREGVNGEHG